MRALLVAALLSSCTCAQIIGGPEADSLRVIDSDGGTVGAAPDSIRIIDTDGAPLVGAEGIKGIDTDGGDVVNLESLGPGVRDGMDKLGSHARGASDYAVDKLDEFGRYIVDKGGPVAEAKADELLEDVGEIVSEVKATRAMMERAVLGDEDELGLLGQLDYANGATDAALTRLAGAVELLSYLVGGSVVAAVLAWIVWLLFLRKSKLTAEDVAAILASQFQLTQATIPPPSDSSVDGHPTVTANLGEPS